MDTHTQGAALAQGDWGAESWTAMELVGDHGQLVFQRLLFSLLARCLCLSPFISLFSLARSRGAVTLFVQIVTCFGMTHDVFYFLLFV